MMGTFKDLVDLNMNALVTARFGSLEGASAPPAWLAKGAEAGAQAIVNAIAEAGSPSPAIPPVKATFSSVPPTAAEFQAAFGATHNPADQSLSLPMKTAPFDKADAIKRARFGFNADGYRGVGWAQLAGVYAWLKEVEDGNEMIPSVWDHDFCVYLMLTGQLVTNEQSQRVFGYLRCPSNGQGLEYTGTGEGETKAQATIDSYIDHLNKAGYVAPPV